MAIIGIDLGTSNSAAAVLRGGRPVILPSAEGVSLGGKAFPSCVAVTADGQMLVGESARRQVASNPEGTATAFKRQMGRRESETISLADAVLGTKLKVPTLDRSAEVTVPPGTQQDTVLRVRGKGLPDFGGRQHGDIFLRIRVHIPERLSAEERDLYQKLRDLAGEQHRSSSWWHL